jgi:hypothetical protein
MYNVLDEFAHESLAIRVGRKLKAVDVNDVLSDLFIARGLPAHIRSHNAPSSSVAAGSQKTLVCGSALSVAICSSRCFWSKALGCQNLSCRFRV